ncbi:hypothetical protein P7C73_g4528, partial [Tremellales sp. Uapishka_1]
MIPTTAFLRQTAPGLRTAMARPLVHIRAPAPKGLGIAGQRFNMEESRGGKSKLIFRFGLKDVPTELYPMMFVVGAAVVGATFAIGRHFWLDGLRLTPSGGKSPK